MKENIYMAVQKAQQKKDLEFLKSRAYDLLVIRNKVSQELAQVEAEIAKKGGQ